MSINMGHDGEETDYSDFAHQQVNFQTTVDEADLTGSPAAVRVQHEVEPLAGRGGLAQNEVAELVYFRLEARTADFSDSADQNVGSHVVIFGSFGMNLQATGDELNPADAGDATVFRREGTTDDAGNTATLSDVDDRVLCRFAHTSTPPFDDEANGLGGGGQVEPGDVRERNFRDMLGRGPVLDSSDDLTAVYDLEGEDVIVTFVGDIAVDLVWDVAEVSDAGRAFSVPK